MGKKLSTIIVVGGFCFAFTIQTVFAHGPAGQSASSHGRAGVSPHAGQPKCGESRPGFAAPKFASGFGYGGGYYAGYGWGGYGYGLAGWGYGLGDFCYYPESLPYFDLFPPVYYSYADGAIVPTSAISLSGVGDAAGPPPQVAPPAGRPTPPLRIANPYYSAEK